MDGLFEDPAPPQPANGAYRVLARKYRPTRFEDLIGQEPMVRTLANSFAANRVHQAYILTGVRTIGSWPIRSSKRVGRYLRARTR